MKKYILVMVAISTLAIALHSCTKKSNYDCTGLSPTYANSIKAILDANCASSGCHNATSKADGIDLSTYAEVKIHTTHGAFLSSIEHKSGYESMPKGSAKLSDDKIKSIACWIEAGAPQ